ncbi:MAG: class I SAM-dependent methyltransferase [Deltaproteobacteria bacterium]|nr:class I SAM-dependent methyltransferase [Deltaproteobacteria bacterium]MBN2670459.1 class I SAM-dependent methyltransferase [Deltaproteobacteria bacterium]
MTVRDNPWKSISPEDYEGHMSSPAVNQLGFLSDCFRRCLQTYSPRNVAVIGCGTGNGLEHIETTCTTRTTVVDMNPAFLEVLRSRYAARISGLEIVEGDLLQCELPGEYSLIFGGLVFEFVPYKKLLRRVAEWLTVDGIFSVVLQLPNSNLPDVSDTRFERLKTLNQIVQLVDVPQFIQHCVQLQLHQIDDCVQTLNSGKSFYIGTFQKL